MKFKVNEGLSEATPYMLTKTGELIKSGLIHPYIKYHPESSNKQQIEYLINNRTASVKWLLDNLEEDSVKSDLLLLLKFLAASEDFDVNKKYLKNIFGIEPAPEYKASAFDIEQLFLLLNNEVNQTYCRVRTSNMRFAGTSNDIYFRISSVGFNWFPLIWQCVYDHKDWISSVTITSDSQAFNAPTKVYKHNRKDIDHMPVDEFLTLSGNPVVEKYNKFQTTSPLTELYYNVHPGHINNQIMMLQEEYMNETFTKEVVE